MGVTDLTVVDFRIGMGFEWQIVPSNGNGRLQESELIPIVHANQITQWKSQLLEGAVGVFGGEAKAEAATAVVDLESRPNGVLDESAQRLGALVGHDGKPVAPFWVGR